MNRLVAILCLSLPLIGCASFSVEPPISNRFSETVEPLPKLEFTSKDLVAIPDKPKPEKLEVEGTTYIAFTPEEFASVIDLGKAASFNTDIAEYSLGLNETLLTERENLILLGKYEEERANYYAEKWAMAEEDLQREIFKSRVETASYQVLLGLALLALVL